MSVEVTLFASLISALGLAHACPLRSYGPYVLYQEEPGQTFCFAALFWCLFLDFHEICPFIL